MYKQGFSAVDPWVQEHLFGKTGIKEIFLEKLTPVIQVSVRGTALCCYQMGSRVCFFK